MGLVGLLLLLCSGSIKLGWAESYVYMFASLATSVSSVSVVLWIQWFHSLIHKKFCSFICIFGSNLVLSIDIVYV